MKGKKMNVDGVKLLNFSNIEDMLGKQIELSEEGGKFPFKIRRIFYSYATEKGTVRGAHANRESEFVLISVSGTLKVRVDDGKREKVYDLENPSMGLYIPRMVWKEMYDFSEDSVLLVTSSEPYDVNEYIRNYDDFLMEIKNREN